ncbi:MAG TPA: NmrA/HSCARG family protein [Gemmatimonadaceae bacterium]|nr:NmrA/HSCARG family protein [Gemmatimonadaceae bacterium]
MSSPQTSQRLIVVTGATGKQGGAVARRLVERGFRVRAITRDPRKSAASRLTELGAEVVRGDLDDPASLRASLDGAYGMFSVQNFWETGYEREVRQGVALAELAKDVGVEHFVYSSVGSAHRNTGLSHFESKWRIEERIRALGLPYTIFRPVFLMDNWQAPALRASLLGGTLAQPLDPGRTLQQLSANDIGAFVALAFQDPATWRGRELDLAGDELTMQQTAETFGRVIGRPVKYMQLSWEQFSAAAGDEYARMYRWFDQTGYEADIPALRKIDPQLMTLERYLRAHDWEGAAQPAGA